MCLTKQVFADQGKGTYQQVRDNALQPCVIITVHGCLSEQRDGCDLALLHTHTPQQRAQQDCHQDHALSRVRGRGTLNSPQWS